MVAKDAADWQVDGKFRQCVRRSRAAEPGLRNLTKAQLASEIRQVIKRRRLTQVCSGASVDGHRPAESVRADQRPTWRISPANG